MYEKHIGFSNVSPKLWPGKSEAEILIKTITKMSPGLGDEKDYNLCDSMSRRFYNVNRTQKIQLKIDTSKGNVNYN